MRVCVCVCMHMCMCVCGVLLTHKFLKLRFMSADFLTSLHTEHLYLTLSPLCRYYGRKCLNQLWPQPDFDRVAARVLSDQLMGKAREAIDNLKVRNGTVVCKI